VNNKCREYVILFVNIWAKTVWFEKEQKKNKIFQIVQDIVTFLNQIIWFFYIMIPLIILYKSIKVL